MAEHTPDAAVSRRAFLATSAGVAAGALLACGDGGAPGANGPPGDAGGDANGPPGDAGGDTAAGPDVAPRPSDTGDDVGPDAPPLAELFAPDPLPVDATGFPLGVQAGDPTHASAVLWTRASAATALELVVFDAGGEVAARRAVTPAEGGYVHADVGGLAAATAYRYCFLGPGGRSPVGRFATAPAPGMRPRVVLGASSCSRYTFRPFRALSAAAADDLDAFILLGDTVYADGSEDLPGYRASWAQNFGVDGYRELLPAVACVATWDDHEVEDNWDPETIDPARLAAARAAFFEHLAVRRDPAHPERIWRRLRFGDTVELFVLDSRSERLPSTRGGEGATYLSEEQLAWLGDGLARSAATFKIIVNSVPITAMPPLFLGASNRWPGYAAQRQRALAHAAGIDGVLWLAGDFHFGAVTRVDPPGGDHFDQVEVLAGPIAHVGAAAVVQHTGDPAQFPWVSGARNYARLTADPEASPPTLKVEHIGGGGEVLHAVVLSSAGGAWSMSEPPDE